MNKNTSHNIEKHEANVSVLTIPAIILTYILYMYYFSPVQSWKRPDSMKSLEMFGMFAFLIGLIIVVLSFLYLVTKLRRRDAESIVHGLMFLLPVYYLLLTVPYYWIVRAWIEVNSVQNVTETFPLNQYLDQLLPMIIIILLIRILIVSLANNLNKYMAYFSGPPNAEIKSDTLENEIGD